jgi:hypothetical protein
VSGDVFSGIGLPFPGLRSRGALPYQIRIRDYYSFKFNKLNNISKKLDKLSEHASKSAPFIAGIFDGLIYCVFVPNTVRGGPQLLGERWGIQGAGKMVWGAWAPWITATSASI